jgi:tetratricopeptide (TPR) repeat protein
MCLSDVGRFDGLHQRQKRTAMNWAVPTLIVLAALNGKAASPASDFAAGREFYNSGDFKKAAGRLELAVRTGPDNAAAYYWLGMSYQRLADISMPFGGRYHARARCSLMKAVELAPDRSDYRQALFDFLLDPEESSRSSRRHAAALLAAVPESDPDYPTMRRRLESASGTGFSLDSAIADIFLMGPRAAYRIAALPFDALNK